MRQQVMLVIIATTTRTTQNQRNNELNRMHETGEEDEEEEEFVYGERNSSSIGKWNGMNCATPTFENHMKTGVFVRMR